METLIPATLTREGDLYLLAFNGSPLLKFSTLAEVYATARDLGILLDSET